MRFGGPGIDVPSELLEGEIHGDSIALRNQQGRRVLEGKSDGKQLLVRLLAGDQVRRVVMEDRFGPTARPIRFSRTS